MTEQCAYIVATGHYSEYTIRAVFSSEEPAQQAIDWYYPDGTIEEYTLNPDHPIPEHGKKTWIVQISENGAFCDVAQVEPTDHYSEGSWQRTFRQGKYVFVYSFYTLAFDEEHAKKIAGERLAVAMTDGSLDETQRMLERRY